MWGVYKNGNATCRINLENGTKIRETEDDEFNLEFPESIDLNIGNRCDGGCQYCYINASPNGQDAELLDVPFLDTLHPFTEVAINGNSIDHPQLIPFLNKMKNMDVICNITVNQVHFESKEELIGDLYKHNLIHGIGVSLRKPTNEFIKRIQKYPTAVIHTINGILDADDIDTMRNHNLKLLVLGYKNIGRGSEYFQENKETVLINQQYLYNILPTFLEDNSFSLLSFDNLALEQLDVQRCVSKEKWDEIYMGDDGTASMYVDLVSKRFGISSLCKEDQMHPLFQNIETMFSVVQADRMLGKIPLDNGNIGAYNKN